MEENKTPRVLQSLSDDDVTEVDHPCRYSQVEMRTPRARPQNPSEPRTPSKRQSAKTFSLGSPLVTPKLDQKKAKYRSTRRPAEVAKPEFGDKDIKPDAKKNFLSPGFTQKELEVSAHAVRTEDSRFKWPAVEADEDEQLLRRFDMEAMYGPSVGLSREERWKQAEVMGLKPPSEVISALQRNPQSTQSVFDQRLNPDAPPAL